MPYVNVQILRGATLAQKRALVGDITRSLVERLGKTPEHIHIVIDEVSRENWGFAGYLTSELPRDIAKGRTRSRSGSARSGSRAVASSTRSG